MEDIRKAQSQKLFIHPIKKWRLDSLINKKLGEGGFEPPILEGKF